MSQGISQWSLSWALHAARSLLEILSASPLPDPARTLSLKSIF